MTHPIVIRPEAERDLAEGFDWYELRRQGLGYEFLEEIHALLTKIDLNPRRHAEVYRHVRMGFPRRFPYRVLYIFEQDRIDVIGIVHVGRDPRFWQKRVP